MQFITLTIANPVTKTETPVAIRPDAIDCITVHDDFTMLTLRNADKVSVNESVGDIIKLISEAELEVANEE